jgi:3-deoxy-manno-octulosonate cytidylyltransferase (CMP-KDO synthetase)
MSALGIVPARFAASRFPGKPLALIAGRPMIEHVVTNARRAKSLRDVWVATDDERIAEACRGFDAHVVMTSPDHPTGSDRLAEVAADVDDEIIVNIQGDEPLIEGFVVDAAVQALREAPDVPMSTVVHAADAASSDDPNRVKVARDLSGNALYFSRSVLPFPRAEATTLWQHIGLYAYRREFLLQYVTLEPTPLERAEALEQLRALEHGYPIRCAVIEGWESVPVDTEADRDRVEAILLARENA